LVKYILPNNQNILTMRCKKCGFIKKNNIQRVMSWREWQLCSICAVEEHPESYTHPQRYPNEPENKYKSRIGVKSTFGL